MKYKIKTRLFAALALSGVSFYWPASESLAQEDGFGFIRPAEPTRQDGQQHNVPPITQAPSMRSAGASAPKAFAASNVFNGAYVDSGAENVGYAQHVSPSGNQERATTRRVAYNQPQSATSQVPVVSGLQAQRDLPPIVNSAQSTGRRGYPQIVQPIEQNELPPIQSSLQPKSNSTLPPIVTPNAGLERLLHPIPKKVDNVASGEMIQDEFMLNADSSAINGSSRVTPAAAFGASPLFVQDAPPIIGGSVDPGSLPSSDGLLVPGDGSSRPCHVAELLIPSHEQRRLTQPMFQYLSLSWVQAREMCRKRVLAHGMCKQLVLALEAGLIHNHARLTLTQTGNHNLLSATLAVQLVATLEVMSAE